MVIDQVFRYYEPQNTTSTSHLPNFIESAAATTGREVKPLNQCTIVCSNPNIRVASSGDYIDATVENKKSLSVQRGCIFVYSDSYREKLLGACRIEVQAVN